MSKKLLLGLLALASAQTAAVAQQRPGHSLDRALLRQTRPVKINRMPTDNASGGAAATASNRPLAATPASWGTMVGQTTYDLQTNRATANRIAADGNNMTNVWTQTCVVGTAPNYPQRGIGHNVSSDAGQTWARGAAGNCPSNFGISNVRVGWPEIAYVNGFEFVAAHTGSGIATSRRPVGGGTAAWPATTVLPFSVGTDGGSANGTWPRVAASGNTVHMVYCSNGSTTDPQMPSGVINPMHYNRSTDGGVTWVDTNIQLPGMDASNFESIGGDQYAVHANGSTVAITTGAFGDHVVIWKSTNDGATFVPRTIIGDYTDADTITVNTATGQDTAVIAPDGSMSILVDNTGKVHWFCGTQLIQVERDSLNPSRWISTGTYFPDAVSELWYWNDGELAGCAPVIAAEIDPTVPSTATFQTLATGNNSSRQTYNVIGPVSMPTAAVDANGDVYVIYASGVLGTSNDGTSDGQYYRDLYLQRLSFSGGQVMGYTPKNISRDLKGVTPDGAAAISEESVFPSAVHSIINGKLHYQWMSDFEPGNALQPTASPDPEVENAIMYDAIDLASVNWTGGQVLTCTPLGVANNVKNFVNFASVSPNPTTGEAVLTLEAKQAARATVTVRDVLGRQVLALPAADLQQGTNKLNLNLSNVRPGVYFYTVTTDKFTLTQRVVKQ